MKHNTWWVVALRGGYVGQLYASETSARWEWEDQEGTTFHQVKLVPVKKTKKAKKSKKVKLGEFEFMCPKCNAVAKKSGYCIAQQAMGHIITYSCKCGHKFEVPES